MTSSERIIIGKITCPVCGTKDQELRQATTGRAYMNCDECDCQVFARSKFSDSKLRALVVAAAPTPAPAPPASPKKDPPSAKPAAEPTVKRAARGGFF